MEGGPGRGRRRTAGPPGGQPTFLQGHLHQDPVVGLGAAGGRFRAFQDEGVAVLGDTGAGAQGAAQCGGQVVAQGVGDRQAGPHREGEEPLFGLLKGKREGHGFQQQLGAR